MEWRPGHARLCPSSLQKTIDDRRPLQDGEAPSRPAGSSSSSEAYTYGSYTDERASYAYAYGTIAHRQHYVRVAADVWMEHTLCMLHMHICLESTT